MQNNLTELYSLLSFVAPGVFRRRLKDDFLEEYEDMTQDRGETEIGTNRLVTSPVKGYKDRIQVRHSLDCIHWNIL